LTVASPMCRGSNLMWMHSEWWELEKVTKLEDMLGIR
jgi:hypothetical protein